MEFVDATYIAPAGGAGRTKEPNPYTKVIAEIALKVDPKTDKPLAKGFLMNDDDTLKANVSKAKRQLADAGKDNTPAVSVISKYVPAVDGKGKPVAGKVLFSFWTGPQQKRPRKPKTAETVAAVAK
jgi:hypothetical protein